jgi:hypothetical protein
MNDAGAIRVATGNADYTALDNRVYNNKIHDVSDAATLDASGYGGDGIYLDEYTGAVDVQNNLIYRVSRAGVNMPLALRASNLANVIKNNIIAFPRLSTILNNRPYPDGTVPLQPIQIFSATNNIFLFDRTDASSPSFYVQGGCTFSGGFPYGQFHDRRSNLYWRIDGSFAADPRGFHVQPAAGPPGANTICRNATPSAWTFMTFAAWQAFGQDQGSVVMNPGFANPGFPADDFSLPNGAPGAGFVVFNPNDAGRSSAAFTPPAVPATFPTQTFNPATDF